MCFPLLLPEAVPRSCRSCKGSTSSSSQECDACAGCPNFRRRSSVGVASLRGTETEIQSELLVRRLCILKKKPYRTALRAKRKTAQFTTASHVRPKVLQSQHFVIRFCCHHHTALRKPMSQTRRTFPRKFRRSLPVKLQPPREKFRKHLRPRASAGGDRRCTCRSSRLGQHGHRN